MIELKIDYLPCVNFPLANNHIDICNKIEVKNCTESDAKDVVVVLSGEYFETTRSAACTLQDGKTMCIKGLDLKLNVAKIVALTEKVATRFTASVVSPGVGGAEADEVIFSKEFDIDIMPYDHWLGFAVMPQCLASFVLPNHPAVEALVAKTGQMMKDMYDHSQLTEYQTGDINEVKRQVAAVFAVLHNENLIYRALPASFEKTGQRVTLPDQVLSSKLGNCIELTLLYASVLESIGIHSGLVLMAGHAYLGVWLVDSCCPNSVCDDSAYLEKKCSAGIDEMLVIECTEVTSESTTFETAVSKARLNLAKHYAFNMFIDIKRSRLEGILPLPQKAGADGAMVIDIDGVEHDRCVLDVEERSRYDLSNVSKGAQKLTKLDIWERKLLDFSLRNSLLNLRLSLKAMQFISFDIHLLEDRLHDGKEYVINPCPNSNKPNHGKSLVPSKLLPSLHELVKTDIEHHTLHSYLAEDEMKLVLKNLYRASRNAIEETGANALFLAIGTLRWFESERHVVPRYAPIILIPVNILYKRGEYYISSRDEETMLNITLIEFLRQNFDISIPGLSPLPTDEHGVDVMRIFAIIRDALKNQSRWDVEEEAVLGVFSFNKFLMWNDIHNHRDALLSNDIIRSLVDGGLTYKPSLIGSSLRTADRTERPDSVALPVSIDSSQMAAVLEAAKGNSFILYGPPGTGKSQTITNLIANALYQGKRVLFVAEKMAALSVVQKRLDDIGLAPFCLEMHSNKLTKRHVLEQFQQALNVAHTAQPEKYERAADALYEQRLILINYMEALHQPSAPFGLSLYDCILRSKTLTAEPLDVDCTDADLRKKFDIKRIDVYQRLLADKYRVVTSLVGQPSQHPLLGLNIDEHRLGHLDELRATMATTTSTLTITPTERQQLSEITALRNEILRDSSPAILKLNATKLRQKWRTIHTRWFLPRFFQKRSFMKRLRKYCPTLLKDEVETLIQRLTDYHKNSQRLVQIQQAMGAFSSTPFSGDALPSEEDVQAITSRLTTWSANLDKARDWYQWCAFKQELTAEGLGVVVARIEAAPVAPDTLSDAFFKTFYTTIAKEKINNAPLLRTFEGTIFDETVERYKALTAEFQELSRKALYARLAERVPRVVKTIDESSIIGQICRNISSGGRNKSIRDLLTLAAPLMPRLCPCMLMSPMSVAQYIDLATEKFDLVIFDEASQMPTCEAVGAIARGRSLVVVGDPKQMPPTSFFTSTSVNDDEADIDDMESILEDCRTLQMPALQLSWHYRSRHESLIAFSNNEYYNGSLITFPSVDDQTSRVHLQLVDGVYDKGGKRSNPEEAEAIVKEVARRLSSPQLAADSIGIIAFSIAQQCLIEDKLNALLDGNPQLRKAADEMYEPIFVKNLENVQGDERDIILFSIGYGPDKNGKVSMNFGPLNNAGGERRLNVAVSRARKEMYVFTSMKAEQIDLRRTQARGVEGLKHFLEFAESQTLVQYSDATAQTPESLVTSEIAAALRSRGHNVVTSVGRSNFRVDIAIAPTEATGKAPYTLGLLLDGQSYADTLTTRDREIVQPTVLENLRWNVMRVWTVDWVNNPKRVIARIEQRLAACQQLTASKPGDAIAPTATAAPTAKEESDKADDNAATAAPPPSGLMPYTAYNDKHHAGRMSDDQLVCAIVNCEAPITFSLLCRRFSKLRDMPRVTPATSDIVQTAVDKSLYSVKQGHAITIWPSREAAETFSGYRQHNDRDISEIPMPEVENALLEVISEQFIIPQERLTLLAARKLGFTRKGTNLTNVLTAGVQRLADRGNVTIDGSMVGLANPS